jgi:hypothetical protein
VVTAWSPSDIAEKYNRLLDKLLSIAELTEQQLKRNVKKRRTCSLLDIEQNFKEFFIRVLETGQTQLRFTDLGNFQFFYLLAKEKFQTYSKGFPGIHSYNHRRQ